jgi:hypothetical protein
MSTEVTITSLADNVQNRVRSVIVDALPDDAVNKLIQSEISKMLAPPHGWNRDGRSPLQQVIHDQLNTILRQKVAAYIDANIEKQWNSSGCEVALSQGLSEAVGKVAINALIGQVVGEAMITIRSNLQTR